MAANLPLNKGYPYFVLVLSNIKNDEVVFHRTFGNVKICRSEALADSDKIHEQAEDLYAYSLLLELPGSQTIEGFWKLLKVVR